LDLRDAIKRYVKEHGLTDHVRVSVSGCQGLCEEGPNVMVFPDGIWYRRVGSSDLETILQTHLAPLIQSPSSAGHPAVSSAVRVLLFDLGNVLLPFDHLRAVRAMAPHLDRPLAEVYQSFFESPLQALHDEGKLSGREFFECLTRDFGLRLDYGRFLAAWNDIFWEDPAMTALVEQLALSYRLIGISNTNRLHFDYAHARYPVVRRVSAWVLSCDMGVRKPAPAIYERALEAAGVSPGEILYVDDRLDRGEAGRALGLRGISFINAPRLRMQLARFGVSV